MARDSSGPKNEPQYSSSGAPADAADMTEIAAFAAAVGNMKVGTNSQRTGLSGADVWVGLGFYETDTDTFWRYKSTGWVLWDVEAPLTVGSGITLAAGVTQASSRLPVRVWRDRGTVFVEGCVNGSSASAFQLFTLQAGYIPPGEVHIFADQGTYVQITTSGSVNSTITGTKSNLTFSGHFHL